MSLRWGGRASILPAGRCLGVRGAPVRSLSAPLDTAPFGAAAGQGPRRVVTGQAAFSGKVEEEIRVRAQKAHGWAVVPSPAVRTFVQLMPVFRYRSLPAEFDP